MDLFEYMSESQKRSEAQLAQILAFAKRAGLGLVAFGLALIGVILMAQGFKTKHTETSGHLWWKHTTTTAVPMATRLMYLVVGIALILGAGLCVAVVVNRARWRAGQKKYIAILTGLETIEVREIAAKTGQNRAKVLRDIQHMIDSGAVDDFYIDHKSEQVVSKKYVPKSSRKTVVSCVSCGSNNEVIVGITRPCRGCGEPLLVP